MGAPLAVLTRVLAFIGKEIVEVLRRPGAIVSLVAGPFLIMAIFGLGYNGVRRPLDTVVVIPPGSGLATDLATYQELAGGGLRIDQVTPDRSSAEARLAAGAVDVVIVAPADPQRAFETGKQSVIDVLIDSVDPIQANYAGFLAAGLASGVNQRVIERAAAEGVHLATEAGVRGATRIPPAVVAAPTRANLVNRAPSDPGVVGYFGPAVLALILQHLAVTLVAMSLVRERMSGVMELFRVAPVSSAEILAGKLLAFALIGGGVAAITVTLLVVGLGVPLLADPAALAGAIALLLVASLGLGLVIAVVSDSERQAVQLSLLVLIGSVFFSGFVLSIDQFTEPVRGLAYLLPVTHGIRLIGDLMLRGDTTKTWEFTALAVIALVTLVAAWGLLRRSMIRADERVPCRADATRRPAPMWRSKADRCQPRHVRETRVDHRGAGGTRPTAPGASSESADRSERVTVIRFEWRTSELKLVRPERLALLGATAAQALVGPGVRVTHDHGRRIESTMAPVVTVTIHPSAVLRARGRQAREAAMFGLIEDLRRTAAIDVSTDAADGAR